MRFIADHMLGSLARWLRFLGFDTAYPDVLADKELIELAKQEKRILLTRDRDLANAKNVEAIYIQSTDLDDQLVQVMRSYNLKVEDPFTRCSVCNSPLVTVEKTSVEGKVPEKVYAWQDEYWKCEKCDKHYWPGTHFQGIKKKIEELERKTSAA